jgi:hypothetical protein
VGSEEWVIFHGEAASQESRGGVRDEPRLPFSSLLFEDFRADGTRNWIAGRVVEVISLLNRSTSFKLARNHEVTSVVYFKRSKNCVLIDYSRKVSHTKAGCN